MSNNEAILTIGAKAHAATTSAFAAISKGMKSVASGMREQAKELKAIGNTKAAKTLSESAKAMFSLNKALDINLKALKSATVAEDKVAKSREKSLKNIGKSTAALQKSGDQLQKQSKNLMDLVSSMEKAAKQSTVFDKAVTKLGKSFKTYLSYTIVAGALNALRQSFTGATAVIIDYDQALHDLQAITQSTGEETALMGEKITQVATSTKFSLSEVSEGMKTLGQAGFSATESIAAIQGVSDLATGTLSDIKTTVDLVSTALRVFQLDFSDASHVADVFANAVNGSKLTIDKLRTSFNYIGPVAKLSGVSFEDLTATMMDLANHGIRASTIGTGLRQVFSKLVKPTKDFEKAIKQAGLSLSDLNPKYHDMETVITNLGLVVTDAEDAFRFFGMRGSSAVAALVEGGAEGFREMQMLVSRTGIAAEMAETQMEGLGIQFKNLRDRVGVLVKALGEAGLISVFRLIVNVTRPLITLLTVLVDSGLIPLAAVMTTAALASIYLSGVLPVLIARFVTLFGATTTSTVAFGGYTVAAGTATVATTGLATAVSRLKDLFLTHPIIVLLTVAAGAIYLLSTHSDRAAKKANKLRVESEQLRSEFKSSVKELRTLEEAELSELEVMNRKDKILFKLTSKYPQYSAELLKASGSVKTLADEADRLNDSITAAGAKSSLLALYAATPGDYEKLKQDLDFANTELESTVGMSPETEAGYELAAAKTKKKLRGLTSDIVLSVYKAYKEAGIRADFNMFPAEIRNEIFEEANLLFIGLDKIKSDHVENEKLSDEEKLKNLRHTFTKLKYERKKLTDNVTDEVTQEELLVPWKFDDEWANLWGSAPKEMKEEIWDLAEGVKEEYEKAMGANKLDSGAYLNLDVAEANALVEATLLLYEASAIKRAEIEQRTANKNKIEISNFERTIDKNDAVATSELNDMVREEEKRASKAALKEAQDKLSVLRKLEEKGAIVSRDNAEELDAQYTALSDSKVNYVKTVTKAISGSTADDTKILVTEMKQLSEESKRAEKSYELSNSELDTMVDKGEMLVFTAEKLKIAEEEVALEHALSLKYMEQTLGLSKQELLEEGKLAELKSEISKLEAEIASLTGKSAKNAKAEHDWTLKKRDLDVELVDLQLQHKIDSELDPNRKIELEILQSKLELTNKLAKQEAELALITDTGLRTLKNKEIFNTKKEISQQGLALATIEYEGKIALLDNWRDRAKMTNEEINTIYANAVLSGVLTQEQANDLRVAQTGTLIERLKAKWDEYNGSKESDEEELADLLEESGGAAVDGIVDSLIDLENGTQSAAETFKSMASSIAKDIQKMIVKMLVMKAIGAAMNWWSGGTTDTSQIVAGDNFSTSAAGSVAHSGKSAGSFSNVTRQISAGFADVKHSGVGSDERLTIIRNNESVLTPSQMKSSSPNVTLVNHISVPVEQSKDQAGADAYGKSISRILEASMGQFIQKHKRPGGLLSNA